MGSSPFKALKIRRTQQPHQHDDEVYALDDDDNYEEIINDFPLEEMTTLDVSTKETDLKWWNFIATPQILLHFITNL